MSDYWVPGHAVVRREVQRGRPVHGSALHVVFHDSDLLVTYLAPGSEVASDTARLPTPTQGRLTLVRPDDAYAVDVVWEGPERRFAGWRVDLQEPVRRHEDGFDTLGHPVSFRVQPDGSFEQQVDEARPVEEAAAVEATAAAVRSMLDWRNTWWDESWAAWQPPAQWGALRLPPDWAGAPTVGA